MKIFLDFDGPLIDNSCRLYTLYTDLISEFDKQPLPIESYWNLKRDRVKEEKILQISGLNDPVLIAQYLKKRFDCIESKHYLRLNKIVDGCFDTLRFLKQQGETILITTRQNKENLFWEVIQKKLNPFFSKILCGFDTSLSPSEIKMKMVKENGFMDGSKGIIIGDTEAEIICGQKVGLFTIAITSGIRSIDYLVTLKPGRIFNSITQVSKEWDSIVKEI